MCFIFNCHLWEFWKLNKIVLYSWLSSYSYAQKTEPFFCNTSINLHYKHSHVNTNTFQTTVITLKIKSVNNINNVDLF